MSISFNIVCHYLSVYCSNVWGRRNGNIGSACSEKLYSFVVIILNRRGWLYKVSYLWLHNLVGSFSMRKYHWTWYINLLLIWKTFCIEMPGGLLKFTRTDYLDLAFENNLLIDLLLWWLTTGRINLIIHRQQKIPSVNTVLPCTLKVIGK